MKNSSFSENIPTDKLLIDKRVDEALARLNYLAESGTIGLLTGATGVGKTCILKLFINRLSRNKYRTVYINFTSLTASGLLRLIAKKMGEGSNSIAGKEKTFSQILEKVNQDDLTTILLIDESHLLSNAALVDLRLLIGQNTSNFKVLLCGQEDLRKKIKAHAHAALLNRISVQYQLSAFSVKQSIEYIDHNLKNSGKSTKTISSDAKKIIHEYSSGIPRNINNIITAALLTASSMRIEIIDADFITKIMEELYAF